MSATDAHERTLRSLFREEASEHFAALNRSLGAAKAEPGEHAAHLRAALRAAHSLKGAATITGLLRLQDMVHNFESCVSAIVAGEIPLGEVELDLLYRWLDATHEEMELCCGVSAQRHHDAAQLSADVASHFGSRCQLKPLSFEPDESAPEPEVEDERTSTMRVATAKIDRQLANVEELLRLKIAGEERLQALGRVATMIERWRAMCSEARRLAPRQGRNAGSSSAAAGRAGADHAKLAGLVEEQHALAEQVHEAIGALYAETRDSTHALATLTDSLHADIRAVRMLPVEGALAPLGRMVRDLGRSTGKKVALRISGGDTEVDRDVLEALKDPVMHLLRNAVDHGVEPPSVREVQGKAPEAVLQIQARSRGGALELEVLDDGRGIAAREVAAVALERGLVTREQLGELDEARIRDLVFHDGFSTARAVSDVSGRGVGLAVVRGAVEKLGGRVSLSTVEGRGSCFRLVLPLNLATSRLLLVEACQQLFAFPATAVERAVRIPAAAIRRVDQGYAFELDGKPVPIFRLSDALQLEGSPSTAERLFAVVLSTSVRRAALLVDRILDEQELVARGLGDHLRSVPGVTGMTVLADGRVAPILNPGELLLGRSGKTTDFVKGEQAENRQSRRILVVDDSVTTRTLEKSILEAAGYEVEVATDGAEALERLSRSSFDLVLSDVQMPRVDGLSLVRAIKQDQRLKALPVVLVSSLDAAEQRREGMEAGADAYLSKGEFEQGLLLRTLSRFL